MRHSQAVRTHVARLAILKQMCRSLSLRKGVFVDSRRSRLWDLLVFEVFAAS